MCRFARNIFLSWAVVHLGVALAEASTSPLQRFEYSEVAMGVRARLVVYAPSQKLAEAACKRAFGRIAQLEDVMSDYRPTSELMRLCAKAGGAPVRVSRDLLRVLLKAREVSRLSQGAFDVTVGPLVRLWRDAISTGKLPPASKLDRALKLVGWQKVEIDSRSLTVRLPEHGMLLDLGGIAKGYACDEALKILRQCGVSRALVEMGGDIAVGSPPPGRDGWEIEVPAALPDERRQKLANCGISTSGDTEQFVEIDGKRYSHIVDPRTGLGLTHSTEVTVIARDCTTSDSLATAASVLGPERAKALIRKYYPGARIFVRVADDSSLDAEGYASSLPGQQSSKFKFSQPLGRRESVVVKQGVRPHRCFRKIL
ncbi:MAG: FAD:protein FMN transferase [Armatimonadota bacterium]